MNKWTTNKRSVSLITPWKPNSYTYTRHSYNKINGKYIISTEFLQSNPFCALHCALAVNVNVNTCWNFKFKLHLKQIDLCKVNCTHINNEQINSYKILIDKRTQSNSTNSTTMWPKMGRSSCVYILRWQRFYSIKEIERWTFNDFVHLNY